MTDSHKKFDFEEIPYEDLNIHVSRRGFFDALADEIHGFSEKSDGKAVFSMARLGSLTDEELADIKPAIMEGCSIFSRDGSVWAKPKGALEPVELFPMNSPTLIIFNLMNGRTSIQEISLGLMEKTGWEEDRCRATTRTFFLNLVKGGVCRPN